MSKQGYIPTRDELAQFIRTKSKEYFPDRSEFGIIKSVYTKNRPDHWIGVEGLLNQYNMRSWDNLVLDLTGLIATRKDYTIFPDKEELRCFIIDYSRQRFPDCPGWAISVMHYDKDRPDRWAGSRATLEAYGYPYAAKGWNAMVSNLTNLTVPSVSLLKEYDAQKLIMQREDEAMRKLVEEIDEGAGDIFYDSDTGMVFNREYLPAGESWKLSTMSVLHCRQLNRTEPVRMWDPYRSRSVLVPASTVYQVV